MRKPGVHELASGAFAAYIFFTLMVAPDLFADRIADDPKSLYVGYVALVGSQSNLAIISLGMAVLIFASFFIRHYNIRILVNVVAMLYMAFITASYLFNYPNLSLGLPLVVIIWQMYETNKLIDKSEDEKSRKILQESLAQENASE